MYHIMEKKFFRYNYRTYVAQFCEQGCNGNLWCYVEDKFKEFLRNTELVYLGRFEGRRVMLSEKLQEYEYAVDLGARKLVNEMHKYFKELDKWSAIDNAIVMVGTIKEKQNELIAELRKKGKSWGEIAKRFKRARSTIIQRHQRYIVRLSTGKLKKGLANGRRSEYTLKSKQVANESSS